MRRRGWSLIKTTIDTPKFQSHGTSYKSGNRRVYSKASYDRYKWSLERALLAQVKEPLDAPMLEVSIVFVYPKRKRQRELREFKVGTPDLDNLIKPVLDAMEGICFRNDSAVVRLRDCAKVRDMFAEGYRMEIIVEPAESP